MSILRKILILILVAVFLFSLAMVARILYQGKEEQDAFDALASTVVLPSREESAGETQEEESLSLEALQEENPDFYGWIYIADTRINYPVMYTPQDPEHYLRRAFDGSHSQSGVPFLSADCFEGCGNLLIYGHNMNNGTMFADLLSYKKEEFWREHPLIHFDTPTQEGNYLVVAAFYAQVGEDSSFPYYQYIDLRDQQTFDSYLDQIYRVRQYDTGVEAVYGDSLLTLSTCTNADPDGRFVVVAKQVSSSQ